MSVRRILIAALVAGVSSACGGGGSMTGSNINTGGGNTGGTGGVAVTAQDFAFAPMAVTVKAGNSVTWTNAGAAVHHPVADNSSFDIGQLAPAQSGAYGMGTGVGGSGSFTFTSPGMYSYHCAIHPQMTGTITVTP
jgi:plastocyanin